MPEARTPAQIEADIVRRREQLAETLDEIGVRMHPQTIIGDAKARVASTVDHTLGRAVASVNRLITDVSDSLRDETGAPRLERIVPVALLAAGAVGLVVVSVRRKR
ncbi:membrane protein [Streptomyces sp. RSD-27]|nr:membrane protein [Streptomyces sp. RSD-27]